MEPLTCTSKENHVQVIVLAEGEYSGRQIAERLRCNWPTVARILKEVEGHWVYRQSARNWKAPEDFTASRWCFSAH